MECPWNLNTNTTNQNILFDDSTTRYNKKWPRIENTHNKRSKVKISQQKCNKKLPRFKHSCNKRTKISLHEFLGHGDLELQDNKEHEDYNHNERKRDWDRFETNEKKIKAIPKRGYKYDEHGKIITKHDPYMCGVRNARRLMSFPCHIRTGDAAGFDCCIFNRVYNQLRLRVGSNYKKTKMRNRKKKMATTKNGDARPLLDKLFHKQLLEQINSIVSTGKEALIYHAKINPYYVENEFVHKKRKKSCSNYPDAEINELENENITSNKKPKALLKECAIKIFRTTLNEFKQRDRYIKDDFRFKDRYRNRNNFYNTNLWAEKEMDNLKRMKAVGINCPEVVTLKKHVLVMSFVGKNRLAAPKLKDACLSDAELSCAYEEIVETMHKLYNGAKLVHADLSEYNILWHENKCWFIDVAQSVESEHPSALEFLLRDCNNIINFFTRHGLPNIFTKEELFQHITSLNDEPDVRLLDRIHTCGASTRVATVPDQADCPLSCSFDLAWEKSQLPHCLHCHCLEDVTTENPKDASEKTIFM